MRSSVLFPVAVLVLAACRPQESPAPLPAAPSCTSFAVIRWIEDSDGMRIAEIDTLQKLPARSGEAAPDYRNTVPGFARWTIAPDAQFAMQTLSTDSLGSFISNQPVAYETFRTLLARSSAARFHLIPFKIIHSGTTISSISEEYLP